VSNDGQQDQASGKFKKGAGKVLGDDEMRQEGKSQENKGKVKEKVENASDSVKGAVRGVTGKDD
jgi:uncharacterized protein YjbJ (UPF0337 family)